MISAFFDLVYLASDQELIIKFYDMLSTNNSQTNGVLGPANPQKCFHLMWCAQVVSNSSVTKFLVLIGIIKL